MAITKKDVIKLLETIALYLEIQGENPFRITAYRRAAQALERDERSLNEIEDFSEIKGIGAGTNAVIQEFIQEKKSSTLIELEEKVPKGLISLLNIPGLGGKRIAKLYKELNITDEHTLKEACLNGDLEKLPGFGKKSVQNILTALKSKKTNPDRIPIAVMLPIAEKIESFLGNIEEINKFSRAGSLRRVEETIKDLDFIIATDASELVREALLSMNNIKEVIAAGNTKVSIVLEDVYDIHIDFRIVKDEQFATTLHHFTGSKEHNVAMRQIAKSRGEKINEYGVEQSETDEIVTFDSEAAFFSHFGLKFIPPELRQNKGEIESFERKFPLISMDDIAGDLHMHTTWSDGAQSIEEMVEKAIKLGYQYIAITDHSKYLRVANGLNETRLRRQREEIEKLNEKYKEIYIFAGVEMDILPDGSLDFSDDFLKEMDFVIAAIHSSFNQSKEEIMNRLMNAMENPYVHMIAHPTGRIIGRRSGYEVNMDTLLERAKETNTVLEINANPNRFDLSAPIIKQAQEMGVLMAINTDAHRTNTLNDMNYGVSIGKKGWLQKESVINTWELDKLQKFLNEKIF